MPKNAKSHQPRWEPTADEIRAECEKILAALTPEERYRRQVQKPVQFEAQSYHLELPKEHRS